MPGYLRLYKRKFNFTMIGGVSYATSFSSGDPYWNAVGLLLRAKSYKPVTSKIVDISNYQNQLTQIVPSNQVGALTVPTYDVTVTGGARLDPLNNQGGTLSNNNLTYAYTDYTVSNVRATEGMSTGKHYYEYTVQTVSGLGCISIGMKPASYPLSSNFYNVQGSFYPYVGSGALTGLTVLIGCEANLDTRTFFVTVYNAAGTVLTSGYSYSAIGITDPRSDGTGLESGTLYPFTGASNSGDNQIVTANFGASAWDSRSAARRATLSGLGYTFGFGEAAVQTVSPTLNYTKVTPFSAVGWCNTFLNADNSHVSFTDSTNKLDKGTAYTLEFWHYLEAGQVACPLLTKMGSTYDWSTSTGVYYNVRFDATSGYFFSFNTAGTPTVISQGAVSTVGWHHVAIACNGTTTALYVDGTQVATTTAAYTAVTTRTNVRIGGNSFESVKSGRISNLRFVSATAVYNPTLTTLAVPQFALTAITNTQLLTCQDGRFCDNSTNKFALTVTGTPALEASGPFGVYWSNTFSSSSFTAPHATAFLFAATPFTLEAYCYPTDQTGYQAFITTDSPANAGHGVWFGFDAGKPFAAIGNSTGGTWSYSVAATTAIPLNKWSHVALVRNGTALNLYVDGGLVATAAVSTFSLSNPNNTITIGGQISMAQNFLGKLSSVRVVKGTAVYTANFIPSATPLTAITNTQLLTCQNNVLRDNSTNQFALTSTGTVSVATNAPFNMFLGFSAPISIDAVGTVYLNPADASASVTLSNNNLTYFSPGHQGVRANISKTTGKHFWEVTIVSDPTPAVCVGFGLASASLEWYVGSDGATSIGLCPGQSSIFGSGIGYPVGSPGATYGFNLDIDAKTVTITSSYGANVTASFNGILGAGAIFPMFSSHGNGVVNVNFGASSWAIGPLSGYTAIGSIISSAQTLNYTTYDVQSLGVSMYFNGAAGGLVTTSTVLPATAAATTIQLWAYPVSFATDMILLGNYTGVEVTDWKFTVTTTGAIVAHLNGTTARITSAANIVKLNQWNYISFQRTSTTASSLYVNGTLVATYATTIATFGSSTKSIYIGSDSTGASPFFGYISDLRITQNATLAAVAGTVIPSAPQHTNTINTTANSSIYLHMAPSTTDMQQLDWNSAVNPKTISLARTSSEQAKFGNKSIKFDGNTSIFSADTQKEFFFGTANWTIDFWFYGDLAGAAAAGLICSAVNFKGLAVVYSPATGTIGVSLSSNGSSWDIASNVSVTGAAANVWHYFALVRNGTNISAYVDGTRTNIASPAITTAIFSDNSGIRVGSTYNMVRFKGYIDDLRVTRGVARYTNAFPYDSTTASIVSLVHMNGTAGSSVFSDSMGATITNLGSPVLASGQKIGTACGSFNSASGLSLPNSPNYNFGGGNFTIEFWMSTNLGGIPNEGWSLVNCTDGTIFTGWSIWLTSTGRIQLTISNSGQHYNWTASIISPYNDTWTHVAIVRNGGTTSIYIDGVLSDAVTTYVAADCVSDLRIAAPPASGWPTSVGSFGGKLDELVIYKGVAKYTTAFTPSTMEVSSITNSIFPTQYANTALWIKGDPYYNNVVLHMHMEGANSGTFFADQKGHVATVTAATTKTDQYKFGTASAYFNGASKLAFSAQAEFAFGNRDFTIEGWIRPTTAGTLTSIYDSRPSATNGLYPTVVKTAGNVLAFVVSNVNQITGTTALAVDTWYHFAVSRKSGTTRLFLNGLQEGSSYTDANVYIVGAAAPMLGSFGTTNYFTGHMDEIRVTNGVGRYSDPFVVPTVYPDFQSSTTDQYYVNTSALTKWSGSNVIEAISATTLPIVGTVVKDSNVTRYKDAIRFNGLADNYLSIPNSSNFDLGSGDFTIEFWYHPNIVTTNQVILSKRSTGPVAASSYGPFMIFNNLVYLSSTGSSWDITSTLSLGTMVANAWQHIAITRTGTTIRTFRDGNMVTSITSAATLIANSEPVRIGSEVAGVGVNALIEDFRITKGVSRYVGMFTVPLAPLPTTFEQLLTGVLSVNNAVLSATANAGGTLSNGNKTYSYTDYTTSAIRTETGRTTGKWVFQWTLNAQNASSYLNFGFVDSAHAMGGYNPVTIGISVAGNVWETGVADSASYHAIRVNSGTLVGKTFTIAVDFTAMTFRTFVDATENYTVVMNAGTSCPAWSDDNGGAAATFSINTGTLPFAQTALLTTLQSQGYTLGF